MPKFTKDDKTISTNHPAEAVRLKAAGWREVKPGPKPAAQKTEDKK